MDMGLYREIASLTGMGKAFISLIGSGGKTTFMERYADYLRSAGKRVLMTTTTKIMSPHRHDYGADMVFSDDSVLSFRPEGPCAVLYALENPETGKWYCPPIGNLEALMGMYDVVINEADGARLLPVKVHTERDPQVPAFTTFTISILGLWAIGRRTSEVAFGEERDLVVDADYLNWLLHDVEGLLKSSIVGRRAIVFNGAEECCPLPLLKGLEYPSDVHVYAASEREGRIYGKIR
ncbi:MAG: putative selenium-dependent hydroxylase accessory protein YqeC [Spirochaetales bacterium]|nr:putative selenium-dependent hydroxylase accessory protein YqeC [Spirochaetales bacterium]